MDVIKSLRGLYKMVSSMKNNNREFSIIMKKLKDLKKLVLFLQNKTPDQISEDVKEALDKLNKTVISATEPMTKYIESIKLIQLVKASDFQAEFEKVNKRLTEAFVTLSAALHVHQEEKLKEQEIQLNMMEYGILFFVVAFLIMCSLFLYKRFISMKSNNQKFPHIMKKLEALEKQLFSLQNKTLDQISEYVEDILGSGNVLMKEFTESYTLIQFVNANHYKAEFEKLNKSLTLASLTLSEKLELEAKLKTMESKSAKRCFLQ